MTEAMTVADYIIDKHPITNMKLQRIIYFLHAIHLVQTGEPLITDAKFEAWDYGPTIKYVYEEYSGFGGQQITKPITHVILTKENDRFATHEAKFDINNLSANERKFIDRHLPILTGFDSFELTDISHKEPQWKRQNEYGADYNDQLTLNYYSQEENQFWK